MVICGKKYLGGNMLPVILWCSVTYSVRLVICCIMYLGSNILLLYLGLDKSLIEPVM
jgi:hypothetical protein